jgi:hypothetical protein
MVVWQTKLDRARSAKAESGFASDRALITENAPCFLVHWYECLNRTRERKLHIAILGRPVSHRPTTAKPSTFRNGLQTSPKDSNKGLQSHGERQCGDYGRLDHRASSGDCRNKLVKACQVNKRISPRVPKAAACTRSPQPERIAEGVNWMIVALRISRAAPPRSERWRENWGS